MQLLDTVDPQSDTKKVQHTPNPLAQFPSATPPLSLHSVDEKQVPKTFLVVVEDSPVHCLELT